MTANKNGVKINMMTISEGFNVIDAIPIGAGSKDIGSGCIKIE
jgi:hypothetical protein